MICFKDRLTGNLFVLKNWQTLAKIFIVGTSATKTHEECCYNTPFTLKIYVDHAFFEDTKVLFQSILHRCVRAKTKWQNL